MKTVLGIIVIVVLIAATVWLIMRETKLHEREELAKKNMSFLESLNLTGLPIITFHNNGQTLNMVLDTGSNVCLINKQMLPKLKYSEGESHTGIIGLSGTAEGGDTVLLPLSYKDRNFDFECWVTDLTEMVTSLKSEYGVTVHGLLGTGFFTKYKYILDFNSMIAYSLKKD